MCKCVFSQFVMSILVWFFSIHACVATGQEPSTPLQKACDRRDVTQIQALIKHGADVSERDNRGWTLLHYAAYYGSPEVIDVLLAQGLDIEATTGTGETPLLMAVRYSAFESAKRLVSKGANVNAAENTGCTALHAYLENIDASHNYPFLFDVLVSPVNVNVRDANGVTPLHLAAQLNGWFGEKAMESLLATDVDLNARTKQGETALDWAIVAKNYNAVKLLRSKGGVLSTKENTQGVSADPNQEQALVLSNTGFALSLYKALAKDHRNLFLSPYSLSSALAMTSAGAHAQTEQQMASVLQFSMPQKAVQPGFSGLNLWLNRLQDASNVRLDVANSLWLKKGFPIHSEFLSLLKACYGTTIEPVDYAQPELACKTINQWISRHTAQRITHILEPCDVNPDMRLVLTNAVYFKGSWGSPFKSEKTKEMPFYVPDGNTVRVPMMTQKQEFRYARMDGFQVLELPYEGDLFSMLVFLPEQKHGLRQLEETLSVQTLRACMQHLEDEETIVFLPRLSLLSELRLKATLTDMGMTDAFDSEKADFSGISDQRLCIDSVMHRAVIEVNEEGTEAAAVTMVGAVGARASDPPVFQADHPFMFLIQERTTGTVLFMGRVTDPSEKL